MQMANVSGGETKDGQDGEKDTVTLRSFVQGHCIEGGSLVVRLHFLLREKSDEEAKKALTGQMIICSQGGV